MEFQFYLDVKSFKSIVTMRGGEGRKRKKEMKQKKKRKKFLLDGKYYLIYFLKDHPIEIQIYPWFFSWEIIHFIVLLITSKFAMHITALYQVLQATWFGRQSTIKKDRYCRFDLPRLVCLVCISQILQSIIYLLS